MNFFIKNISLNFNQIIGKIDDISFAISQPIESKNNLFSITGSFTGLQLTIKNMEQNFNIKLSGADISNLIEKMEAIKPLIQSVVHANDKLYRALAEAFMKFTSERIALYGKENLLDQPEFNTDVQKLKEMLKFIDSPEKIKEVIDGDESLDCHIGKDENGNGLDDVSFVTKKINVGHGHEGTITLVGPKRMDYDKIVNSLEYLAEQIMNVYGDDDDGRKEPS